MGAVKQPRKKRYQRRICRGIVHRRSHNKPVTFLEFLRRLVDQIVKDTSAFFKTLSTGNTAPDRFTAHLNDLGLNSFFRKDFLHLMERNRCISVLLWASI